MKKLKKLFATLSAVAVCAISTTPFVSNAIATYFSQYPTINTISFTVNNEKYVLWQEASDYFYNIYEEPKLIFDEDWFCGYEMNVFIAEEPVKHEVFDEETNEVIDYKDVYGMYGYYTSYWGSDKENLKSHSDCCPLNFLDEYYVKDEEEKATLENYLTENNIPYETDNLVVTLLFDTKMSIYDRMNVYIDIKDNTGLMCEFGLSESTIEITDIKNAFPEKTLNGDANEDGEVNIADATAIMQYIGNPDKYALTVQGEVNADCYNTGDGITGMDAIAIQKLEATLINSLDEA